MSTRIIDVAAATLLGREDLARFDNTLWMAVLQSLAAYQMYRQKVRRRITGADVIQYLLKDTQFPRAFAFSLREIGASLASLPRHVDPLKKLGDLRRMLAVFDVASANIAMLHRWNDDAQVMLAELHSLIHATWFEPTAKPSAASAAPSSAAQQSQSQTQTETAQAQTQTQTAASQRTV
jgi:uncharacterized alpha-E superfamily protein